MFKILKEPISRRQKLLILLVALFTGSMYCQQSFNLDFEELDEGQPARWASFGSNAYKLNVDTTTAYSGRNSVSIEYSDESQDFRAWSYSIPAKYAGDKIKLTGYIKTREVENGWAGLWLRIDPRAGFDNMQSRGITGTTDWSRYEIELNLNPDRAEKIVFGGLLVGNGKMWLDNLNLTIDGIPIERAREKELLPAQKDTIFNNGSGIAIPALNEQKTQNLEILGKVWGFLKYHHPRISKGDLNWDYELFRMLPDFLDIEDPENRDAFLVDWIEGYGDIQACDPCQDNDADAFIKPDHNWFLEGQVSESLRDALLNISGTKKAGKHYYISMAAMVGNPQFLHESSYENMPYPDDGFRLLALYRYWNMIHYYFPYKHLIDGGWHGKLREHMGAFIEAKDELTYELAALQLIGSIQDTHANLWGGKNAIEDQRGSFYPPFHLGFIENQLTVLDYYNIEHRDIIGLNIGTVITKIDGVPVREIVQNRRKEYPASNEPTRLRDMSAGLLRSNKSELDITYLNDNQEEQKMKLRLYPKDSLQYYRWYRERSEPSYKFLEDNIGYVTLQNIQQDDIEAIKEKFKDAEGIIIDIRNYPSEFVPFALGSFFVEDSAPFVKFTSGQVDFPGTFTFGPPLKIANAEKAFPGKLVVIVNELTQSQAEYTTMAFQAGVNTTVIGSTTAGADGNVSAITLPGGLSTMISGIGVYYPDGRETQRIGIVPDIEVKPTLEGIRNAKDELLERAIKVILDE